MTPLLPVWGTLSTPLWFLRWMLSRPQALQIPTAVGVRLLGQPRKACHCRVLPFQSPDTLLAYFSVIFCSWKPARILWTESLD